MDSDRINEIREIIERHGLRHIYLNFVDVAGQLWTKTVGVKELLANTHVSWTNGISINGKLIDELNCIPDCDWLVIVPDPKRFYCLPFIDDPQQFAGALMCSIKEFELDSRSVLQKAISYSKSLGFCPIAGLQLIYGIHDESVGHAYQSLVFNPANTFNNEVVNALLGSDIDVEYYLHYAQDTNRIDLVPDEMDVIADKYTIAKWFIQSIGFKKRTEVSFDRLSLGKGLSPCPIHLSLWDKNKGNNLFFDPERNLELSYIGECFVNGILKFLPSILGMIAATSNTPVTAFIDSFTPSVSTLRDQYSIINIPMYFEEKKKVDRVGWSKRCIFNTGVSNPNIYLLLSFLLYAGLYGIVNKVEESASALQLSPETVREQLNDNQYFREKIGSLFIDRILERL